MTVATVAAVVVAAAAVGGTVLSATKGGGGGGSLTQTSQLEFPEETRRLLQDIEFPQLASALGEQTGLLGPLLGQPAGLNQNLQAYGQGPVGTAKAATRTGAKQAGITDLGPAFESLGALSPELVAAIQSLALQNAGQRTTAVPTGYGPFLSPSTFTQTSGGGADPYQTGFQLAGAIGNAGLAFARSG